MARQASALETSLAALQPADIVAFRDELLELHGAAYCWDLWGAAHVILQGCSDDNFSDFRAWLISMGRGAYEDALADPDSLVEPASDPSVEDVLFEGLLGIPDAAYAMATGSTIPDAESREPEAPSGVKWNDEPELARHYPRLWARFRKPRPRVIHE